MKLIAKLISQIWCGGDMFIIYNTCTAHIIPRVFIASITTGPFIWWDNTIILGSRLTVRKVISWSHYSGYNLISPPCHFQCISQPTKALLTDVDSVNLTLPLRSKSPYIDKETSTTATASHHVISNSANNKYDAESNLFWYT